MTPGDLEKLQNEQIVGNNAQHIYDSYLQEFCQRKRESLFMAFSELPLSAETELMEVKRMLFAVDALEAEVITEIETGKLASKMLETEDEVKH